jgi:hypothetical protein
MGPSCRTTSLGASAVHMERQRDSSALDVARNFNGRCDILLLCKHLTIKNAVPQTLNEETEKLVVC